MCVVVCFVYLFVCLGGGGINMIMLSILLLDSRMFFT